MKVFSAKRSVALSLARCLVGIFAAIAVWAGLHANPPNGSTIPSSTVRLAEEPSVYLWAWERPEDLRFIKPQDDLGVAFLAETIEILPPSSSKGGSGLVLRPRQQPLRVNEQTPLTAVVRIETPLDLWHSQPGQSHPATSASYTTEQRKRIVEIIDDAAKLPRVSAVQIDFDASQSEQPFYAALLSDVRASLPREMPLSMTALASWCIGDPWIDKLPAGTVDEAVPMLFRMGPDGANIASYVQSGKMFGPSVCHGSVGVSTDEPLSKALLDGTLRSHASGKDSRRVYVFSNHSWTRDEVTNAIAEAEK